MYIWSYGLAEFLRHSNEDAICSRFLADLVQRAVRTIWPDCHNFIRIADLGCGPASKAMGMARLLHQAGIKSHWDLVDIDPKWTDTVVAKVESMKFENEVRFDLHCPCSAQIWRATSERAPHIAQFIQVAYDDETEQAVYEIGKSLAEQKSIIFVVAEHPASDLSRLRQKLSALGYRNLPNERVTSLAQRFRSEGLHVKKFVVRRKFLDIGPVDKLLDADWLWDLIFGEKHNPDDKAKLVPIIKDYARLGTISSAGTSILDIPDVVITVRQRG
jgi:hypothetical protein